MFQNRTHNLALERLYGRTETVIHRLPDELSTQIGMHERSVFRFSHFFERPTHERLPDARLLPMGYIAPHPSKHIFNPTDIPSDRVLKEHLHCLRFNLQSGATAFHANLVCQIAHQMHPVIVRPLLERRNHDNTTAQAIV